MTRIFLSIVLLATAYNMQAQTSVTENDGNIILHQNGTSTVLSATKDASSPVIYNQKVYYLQNSPTTIKSRITSYDINTKQYTDVISVGMKTENGYTIKDNITKMVADTKGGLLYFTTVHTYNNRPQQLTWSYNISTGSYMVFSDGKVDAVDWEGNVTVVMEKQDDKGRFSQKVRFTSARALIKMEDRQYQ